MVNGRHLAPVDYVYAGSARYTPRPETDATKKPKGLEWEYQLGAGDAGMRVATNLGEVARPT